MTSKTRLFIGSLPYNYSESELLKLFVTEGKVIDVRIIKNPWGRSRGMGYVQFEFEEDAIKAKEKYHGYRLGELKIIVDFAKDDPAQTPDGIKKHEEAQAKKKKTFRPPVTHQRQTLFESRHFGSRVGAKFASRNKKK